MFDLEGMAQDAINDAEPTFFALMHLDVLGFHLHILVAERLDPAQNQPGNHRILAERGYGSAASEDAGHGQQFRTVAYQNLLITARTGLPSREVQLLRPELLIDGDGIFWGSALVGNILVACAGAISLHYAEAMSHVVAHLLRARIESERLRQRGDAASFGRGIYES